MTKSPPEIPSSVNYSDFTLKMQLYVCVLCYLSRKLMVLVNVLQCGREGSMDQLGHCTEFLFQSTSTTSRAVTLQKKKKKKGHVILLNRIASVESILSICLVSSIKEQYSSIANPSHS